MMITWLPSPYRNARDSRYPIRAEVKHRIVGSLLSARGAFGAVPGTPRNASTHFGIGYISGVLTIDQYVDLSDMAWGNGDVRDPSWSRIIPGVNPNLYTVSTEHEDGGSANRGRVSEAVWQASMALSKLLRCGDVARIRAAGIRVRDPRHAVELAAMPIDTGSYIDHNQIAGPNKPYCFRRWLDDPGFVEGTPSRRDRLLAALNGEDDMTYLDTLVPIINRRVTIGKGATARTSPAWDASDPDANAITVHAADTTRTAVAWVTGTKLIGLKGEVYSDDPTWLMTDRYAKPGVTYYHKQDVISLEPVEATGVTPEQLAQAKRLEFGRGRDEGIAAYTAGGVKAAKAVTP